MSKPTTPPELLTPPGTFELEGLEVDGDRLIFRLRHLDPSTAPDFGGLVEEWSVRRAALEGYGQPFPECSPTYFHIRERLTGRLWAFAADTPEAIVPRVLEVMRTTGEGGEEAGR